MSKQVTILTEEPTVTLLAQMKLDWDGVGEMAEWVRSHRPECLPDNYDAYDGGNPKAYKLFPHDRMRESTDKIEPLTDNELLVELAGRKCYDSFGLKAGKKSNREYLANTQMHQDPVEKAGNVVASITDSTNVQLIGVNAARDRIADAIRDAQNTVPHASILYHAKMSFFIAGVSRRVSHELIRNYVGADRDEEGSPSQESTRYTEHYGFYVAHPFILTPGRTSEYEQRQFTDAMQDNYDRYRSYVDRHIESYKAHNGRPPSAIERKRIYESASPYLSHSCETSWVWTTNPMALAKMFKERDNDGADLEFRRLAKKWKRVCMAKAPNLFPQPWMRAT